LCKSLAINPQYYNECKQSEVKLNLGRDTRSDEFDPFQFHVVTNLLSNLLVKSSQKNGSHHDGDTQAHGTEETPTLQGDVGGSNQQSLPRGVGQGEQVITERQAQCKTGRTGHH
jgi:hypothetical protein